ncbi:MAG: alpha/beta fold hydrolase [Alphaproteobacteria bacterium]|nr:alpha/beta fold hydrolase [Alphaproteobacteria bacterium]
MHPETPLAFSAQDGTALFGTLFRPESPVAALLVSSGTAIPRGFYKGFARRAAERGFVVLTYDYRGIGDSAPADLSGCTAVYREWGQLDMPAAIAALQAQAPGLPLVAVGHSTGGQQLGLAHNVGEVTAAAFIAVSTGYWRGMPTRMKWVTWALWNVLVPGSGAVLGYLPGSRMGLGEDLPIGVAAEWGDWCMQPDYLGAFLDGSGRRPCRDGRAFGPAHFGSATLPIRAVCFTDDPIATRENVPALQALYPSATFETEWIEPSSLGMREVGHLGFFRRSAASAWEPTLDWLMERAVNPPPA